MSSLSSLHLLVSSLRRRKKAGTHALTGSVQTGRRAQMRSTNVNGLSKSSSSPCRETRRLGKHFFETLDLVIVYQERMNKVSEKCSSIVRLLSNLKMHDHPSQAALCLSVFVTGCSELSYSIYRRHHQQMVILFSNIVV